MSMKYSRTFPANTGKPVKVIYGDYTPSEAERSARLAELIADIKECPEEWDIEDAQRVLTDALLAPTWRRAIGYATLDI